MNPHGFTRRNLNPLRLPVSPREHAFVIHLIAIEPHHLTVSSMSVLSSLLTFGVIRIHGIEALLLDCHRENITRL